MPPSKSQRDSVPRTLLVALTLCVVCSVLVSSAAVLLRPMQEANKKLDQQRNVLLAAGEDVDNMSAEQIVEMFNDESKVQRILVELSTGEVISDDAAKELGIDPATYEPRKAAASKDLSVPVRSADGPTPGVARREKYAFVYKIMNGNEVAKFVLPIYGKGLWSTLYGFLALEGDTRTVAGITFYEHKETPGLGGEVDNANWKAKWPGKEVYDDDWNVDFEVIKGTVDANAPSAPYRVDGLSGATITSRGVSSLVQYWVGPEGFGKYLEQQRGEK